MPEGSPMDEQESYGYCSLRLSRKCISIANDNWFQWAVNDSHKISRKAFKTTLY
jgi:hypothetical protein